MPPQNQNPYQPGQNPQQPQPSQPLQPQPASSYVPQYGQPQPTVQPLQPLPNQPEPHINPKEFEFIMNPGQPKKPLALGIGGLNNKLVLLVLGLVVLLVILFAASTLLKGGSGVNEAAVLKLAQQQTEIVRVADTVAGQATASQRTKDAAYSTSLVVKTDQAELFDYVKTANVKLNEKQLSLGQDPDADAALSAAAASGDYDSAYQTVMKKDLEAYASQLTSLYQASKGEKLRALLADDYNNVQLLLKQLTSN